MGENEKFITAQSGRLLAVGNVPNEVTTCIGPVGDDALDDVCPALRRKNPSLTCISVQRFFDLATSEETRRLTRPLFALTTHAGQLGSTDPSGYGPKGSTGLDRLKLHRVADQDDFRARILRYLKDTRHLLRRDHSGLIDDEDVPTIEQISPIRPGKLPGGECP